MAILMTLHMDIGQLIIALLLVAIGVVGYLIKLQINVFSNRLDRHEGLLFGLVGDVQKLIGISIGKGNATRMDDLGFTTKGKE
jgi:hypothetical protein